MNMANGLPLLPAGIAVGEGTEVGGTAVGGGSVGGGKVRVAGIGVGVAGTGVTVGVALLQEDIRAATGNTTRTSNPIARYILLSELLFMEAPLKSKLLNLALIIVRQVYRTKPRTQTLLQFAHGCDYCGQVRHSSVRIDDIPTRIQHEEAGRSTYPVASSDLQTGWRGHIHPDENGLPCQLTLNPVHDRLGNQAGWSAVGKEIDDRWMAGSKKLLKLLERDERTCLAAQAEPGQRQCHHDQQTQPVLSQEFDALTHLVQSLLST